MRCSLPARDRPNFIAKYRVTQRRTDILIRHDIQLRPKPFCGTLSYREPAAGPAVERVMGIVPLLGLPVPAHFQPNVNARAPDNRQCCAAVPARFWPRLSQRRWPGFSRATPTSSPTIGRQRLVRHGHLPEREIMTGIGPVAVRGLRDLK
jgi:hypothetical protein